MQVGELVQQKECYRTSGRWAIVVESEDWSSSCTIIFTDTGAKFDVYKKSLIVYSSEEKQR